MAEALKPAMRDRIAAQIASRAGLEPKPWVLESRICDRMRALVIDDPADYAALLASRDGRAEFQLLVETLRVGETRFFRHRSHIRALTDVVVPSLAGAGTVRGWSAGCATGQEAYTLALQLSASLPERRVRVLGSDISHEALAVARAGEYPREAIEHVPEALRERGFVDVGEGRVRVHPDVARLIEFEHRNLSEGGYPTGFDLIWCRNVLMYFAPDARAQAIERLIESLNAGGYLFVGYAESLRDFASLEAVRTPDAVLYRRAAGHAPAPPRPEPPGPDRPPASRPTAPSIPVPRAVAEEAHISLSGRYEAGDGRLARELSDAIAGPFTRVVVDLDGADLLADDAAAVLKRARAAARAEGVELRWSATRPGVQRFLARSGLDEGEA